MVLSCTSKPDLNTGTQWANEEKNQVTLSNQSLSSLHLSALTLRKGHQDMLLFLVL